MQYLSESFHISSVDNLRIPTALMLATLLTGALFWTLWSLTNVEVVFPPIKATIIDFTPKEYKPTLATTRDVKPVVEPPPVTPQFPRTTVPTGPETTITKVIPRTTPTGPEYKKLPNIERGEVMPLVKINPDYPPRAITQGIEGWVQVRFTVTAIGTVKDAIIVNSSSNIFEAAALKAVARWRYNPKVENGVGVERVGMETLFKFDLDD